jgi:hypothetical protein
MSIESHGFFSKKTEEASTDADVILTSDYTNKHASISGLVKLGTSMYKKEKLASDEVMTAFANVANSDDKWKDYCRVLSVNLITNCTALNLAGFRNKFRTDPK